MPEAHTVVAVSEPSVFDLLAQQAETRTTRQLGATMAAGAVNAAFFLAHSRAPWLGLAFVAVGAYGMWGLTDRLVVRPIRGSRLARLARGATVAGRYAALAIGVCSALAAAAGFMGVAIGNWNH